MLDSGISTSSIKSKKCSTNHSKISNTSLNPLPLWILTSQLATNSSKKLFLSLRTTRSAPNNLYLTNKNFKNFTIKSKWDSLTAHSRTISNQPYLNSWEWINSFLLAKSYSFCYTPLSTFPNPTKLIETKIYSHKWCMTLLATNFKI